jgi:hypothetical protein
MSTSVPPEVLEALRSASAERRTQLRNAVTVGGGIFGFFAGVFILLTFIKGRFDTDFLTSVIPSLFLIGLGLFALAPKHKKAVQDALALQDPIVVPHLLEVLDSGDEELNAEVRTALQRLLPQLDACHAPLLDSRHRLQLCLLLDSKDAALRKEVIDVLGKVGGVESQDYLAAFTNGKQPEAERHRAGMALGALRHRLAAGAIRASSGQSLGEPATQSVEN